MRLLFINNKGNDKCFNSYSYSLFFLMNIFRRSCSEVFCKKVVLKIHNIYSKKPVPVVCNFIEKETVIGV